MSYCTSRKSHTGEAFLNAAHFGRAFRRRFGVSPGAAATSRLNADRKTGDDPAN
jgi:hypothetical protein